MRERRRALAASGSTLDTAQLSQYMALLRPMILTISLSLASFSATIPLTIMATEKIQAKVMYKGRERANDRRNLKDKRTRPEKVNTSFTSVTNLRPYQRRNAERSYTIPEPSQLDLQDEPADTALHHISCHHPKKSHQLINIIKSNIDRY